MGSAALNAARRVGGSVARWTFRGVLVVGLYLAAFSALSAPTKSASRVFGVVFAGVLILGVYGLSRLGRRWGVDFWREIRRVARWLGVDAWKEIGRGLQRLGRGLQRLGRGLLTSEAASASPTCLRCGADRSAEQRFCRACGTPLPRHMSIRRRVGRWLSTTALMLLAGFCSLIFIAVAANTHAQAIERSGGKPPTYPQAQDGITVFFTLYGVGVLLVAVQTFAPRRGLGLGRLQPWLIPVVCGAIGFITLIVASSPQ
jgi:hypothetical protein